MSRALTASRPQNLIVKNVLAFACTNCLNSKVAIDIEKALVTLLRRLSFIVRMNIHAEGDIMVVLGNRRCPMNV